MIVAPFIKVDALRSLLGVLRESVHLRCVTRWLPRDVAAGVSDPEIIDVLEERGNFTISLVDRLHAKLYIADEECLVGSANVTMLGLGAGHEEGNIEILVATSVSDPAVAATIESIAELERPASRAMAAAARALAANLPSGGAFEENAIVWFPRSRLPENAFRFYTEPPTGFISAVDRGLLTDLASLNIPPGLHEDNFRSAVRAKLLLIPLARRLVDATVDITVTRADAKPELELVATEQFSANDLWTAFVHWMAHFFPDKVITQHITELALRRAERLT